MIETLTKYLEFITISQEYSVVRTVWDFVVDFLFIYLPPIMFGLNLLLPSKRARFISLTLFIIVCFIGTIVGIFGAVLFMSYIGEPFVRSFTGAVIYMIFLVSMILSSIGYILGNVIERFRFRILIAISLILLLFLSWSGCLFFVIE